MQPLGRFARQAETGLGNIGNGRETGRRGTSKKILKKNPSNMTGKGHRKKEDAKSPKTWQRMKPGTLKKSRRQLIRSTKKKI